MSLQDADEYEVTAHLARIENRLAEITEETARLTTAVRQLADEDRQGRLIAQLMVATQIFLHTTGGTERKAPKEVVSTVESSIDGVLMVNTMIDTKRKSQTDRKDSKHG